MAAPTREPREKGKQWSLKIGHRERKWQQHRVGNTGAVEQQPEYRAVRRRQREVRADNRVSVGRQEIEVAKKLRWVVRGSQAMRRSDSNRKGAG